jgi:hypothetical protein
VNTKQLSAWALAFLLGTHIPASVAADATSTPTYKPPLRGAPASRVGGGSRGADSAGAPRIAVLAPDHTGYTTQEQPNLYWYLSKPVATRLEITVINDSSVQPLLEKKLETPIQAGIQCLRLKDLGIKLKPGVEYRWFVGLVADPLQRSNDIIASGTIQRNEPSPALLEKLSRADKQSIPFIYAEEGIWYDAITSISESIAANPKDMSLRQQRAALLEQAELNEPASFDKTQSY